MKRTPSNNKKGGWLDCVGFRLQSCGSLPESHSPVERRECSLHRIRRRIGPWLTLLAYINLALLLPFWSIYDTGYRRLGAMVEGCSKKSCCTSKCYLDQHGVHHCVHEPGESCSCGIASGTDKFVDPSLYYRELVFPKTDALNLQFAARPIFLKSPQRLPELYLSVRQHPPRLHFS